MEIPPQTYTKKPSASPEYRRAFQDRARIRASAFTIQDPLARTDIRLKATWYQDLPVVKALAAWLIMDTVASFAFSSPAELLKISYKRHPQKEQHYVGIFTLELSRLPLDLKEIKSSAIRAMVKEFISRYSLTIETSPFFVENKSVGIADNMGAINFLAEANDAREALLKLREPEENIQLLLVDQLKNKLKKSTFLKTSFTKSAEELANNLVK
jgi:hypothetical protein